MLALEVRLAAAFASSVPDPPQWFADRTTHQSLDDLCIAHFLATHDLLCEFGHRAADSHGAGARNLAAVPIRMVAVGTAQVWGRAPAILPGRITFGAPRIRLLDMPKQPFLGDAGRAPKHVRRRVEALLEAAVSVWLVGKDVVITATTPDVSNSGAPGRAPGRGPGQTKQGCISTVHCTETAWSKQGCYSGLPLLPFASLLATTADDPRMVKEARSFRPRVGLPPSLLRTDSFCVLPLKNAEIDPRRRERPSGDDPSRPPSIELRLRIPCDDASNPSITDCRRRSFCSAHPK